MPKVDCNIRMNPSALKFGPTALNSIDRLRYRNSDDGRKLGKKSLCCLVFVVMSEFFPGGFTHGSSIDIAIKCPLVDECIFDLMRNDGQIPEPGTGYDYPRRSWTQSLYVLNTRPGSGRKDCCGGTVDDI